MSSKEHIKILMAKEDINLTELAALMSKKLDKEMTMSNLSHKLNKNTLRFREAEAIAEVLGYKIKFEK